MKQNQFKAFFVILLITVMYLGACNESDDQKDQENDTAVIEELKYVDTIAFNRETPPELKTPESVKYDVDNKIFYVANINGNPTEKDGNGFISKVSLNGEIVELEWVTGLNAPKGMGIYNGILYVTDIERLVEISIETGKILKDYPAEDAEFLNDVDIDKNGNVYVSDMASDRIFRLSNDGFNLWLQSPKFIKPNGLFVDNNNLLVGVNGQVLSVNIDTKEINTFIDSTGGIDGLESVGNNQYIFSDWSGHIYLSSPGKDIKLILDTAKDTIQAADIEYCPEKDLILVPTFFHNTVSVYELVRK